MKLEQFIEWTIGKHKSTNHYYDTYLPYEFHLRMVVNELIEHLQLKPEYLLESIHNPEGILLAAAWGHDLIEDTRTNYNDILKVSNIKIAELIYALTNEKGKNREERGNNKYYEGIRNTEGASTIKLCDRIANVKYSKMTKSRMFEMYKKENSHFLDQVCNGDKVVIPLKEKLISLF